MADKACFRNAWVRAEQHQAEDWRYCEGWALSAAPLAWIYHAWVVDREDQVVEVTWTRLGLCYFGVQLPISEVAKALLASGIHRLFHLIPIIWGGGAAAKWRLSRPYLGLGYTHVVEAFARCFCPKDGASRSVRRRRADVRAVWVATCCLVLLVIGGPPPISRATVAPAVRRPQLIVHAYDNPWDAACTPEGICVSGGLFLLQVDTPLNAEFVRLIATVTLDFETSLGDAATLMLHAGNAFKRFDGAPGPFEIASLLRTSTTVTWEIPQLPGQGARYTVDALVSPVDLGGDGSTASGELVTVRIELIPAPPPVSRGA
jgi:hypothetical protein